MLTINSGSSSSGGRTKLFSSPSPPEGSSRSLTIVSAAGDGRQHPPVLPLETDRLSRAVGECSLYLVSLE